MSVLFSNVNQYQLVPWSTPTVVMGSFTLACRVYTADITTANQQPIILDGTGGCTTVIQLDTGTTPPAWLMFLTNNAVTAFPGVTGPSNVTINTWYHLCLTYDGTTITAYVNGVSVGTNAPGALTRTGNWLNWVSPSAWIGSMQDVVGYNVALNAAEVLQLASNRKPGHRTGILVDVPMLTLTGAEVNYAGTGVNLVQAGTVPTAGLDTAGIPYGTQSPAGMPMRKQVASAATLTAAQLETAAMNAAAVLLAADIAKGTMAAGANAVGQQVVTALVTAGANFLAAQQAAASAMAASGALGAQLAKATAGGAAGLNTGGAATSGTAGAGIVLGSQVQTAIMSANALPQSLAASQVQTATMVAVAQILGADVQSARETAVAQLLAADVQTGFMFPSGGGGGGGAATRNLTNPARRPLHILGRRGVRAR